MEHNVCTGISDVRYFSPRLLAALTGILSSPLTVIEAPMGYGKTVAVREFLRRENLAVIWVSVLDSPDGAFWRSLCREFERLPETAETARALRRLGPPFAPDDAARRDAALELLESLDFARPTVLVVDDVHLLASAPSCVRFFQILARQAMSNLHIVLTTRHFQTDDALLSDLKGELARLGPALLAFSEEDIRAYCALCGLKVSPEQIRALHGATGGWVSGVYLHCRHYAQHGSFSLPAFARSFTLPSPQSSSLSSPQYSENELPPDMAALLEEQLYRPLSPDVRDMLFALCPLEQFTLPQADFCCGTDTRAALEALVRQNSFVRRREGSGVYTVHAIFRSLLLRLFRALPREQRQAVHRRCGDWFAAEDEFIPAMEHYHAARDFERALSVMERDMARHLVTESAAFFARLFQDCPEEVLSRHPRAAFKHALAALSASDFPAFADRCRWLARYCAALDEAHPATPVLRGELEMLLALAEYNDIAAMSVRHRRAWELLGRPTGLYPPESTWSMGCPSVLFMFHRESGNIREEVRLMRECMPHYYKAAAWHGAGGELLFEAEALYMAGDFTEALRLCRQAETVAALHGQLCNTLCALFLRARLALARKNTSTACAAVREMRDLITKKQDYFLLHTAEVCAARLSGLLRRPDEIPAWVHEGRGERMYAFAQGDFRLAQGRALLLAGDAAAVLGLFHALLQTPLFDKHRLFFIYAHIFLAAAHAMLDAREKALESLRAALDAALPDDVLMPFVENADLVLLLLLAPQETRHEDGVRRILALAEPWLRHLGLPGTRASEIPFGLSVKQYEIARLAAEGRTGPEIACRVGLGLNTVKTHLKTVYRKCGANNRPELRRLLHGEK